MERELKNFFGQNVIEILKQAFELVRIVDPNGKEEIIAQSGTDFRCYDFWKLGKPCDNCVSYRALKSGKAESKVELSGDKAYMVTAIPLEGSEKRYVMEFGKLLDVNNLEIQVEDQSRKLLELLKSLSDRGIKDPLTGLYNRNYLEGNSQHLITKANSLSLAFIDLDKFKSVNDRYGHTAGDQYLKRTAEIIKKNLLNTDYAIRYGGDEFVVILIDTPHDRCHDFLEKLLTDFNQAGIKASIGAVTTTGETEMESLITLADKETYKAKKQGGNRISHSSI